MKANIFAIIATLGTCILISCNDPLKKAPIPVEKLTEIITELHIAEYYSQGLGDSTAKFKKNHDSLALYYNSILAHHQLNFQQLDSGYKWLMNNPEIMDSVYKKVNSNIEELRIKYKTGKSNVDVLPESQALKTNAPKDTLNQTIDSIKATLPPQPQEP